eukprot:5942751-Heterocapsa_arctica.AAC.1
MPRPRRSDSAHCRATAQSALALLLKAAIKACRRSLSTAAALDAVSVGTLARNRVRAKVFV